MQDQERALRLPDHRADSIVAPIHPNAMPVILRTPEEVDTWITAPWEGVKAMQTPLPDDALQMVPAPVKVEK